MNYTSTQFVPSRRMGIYEPIHQVPVWGDFKGINCLDISPSMILEDVDAKLDNQSEDTSHGTVGHSDRFDQEANKPEKVKRRLAQNREAARKSRLRKKAYVQQLESSKLRLVQLEQELHQTRQQGHCGGSDTNQLGYSTPINQGIATFDLEYGQWVEEHNKQISVLRNALQTPEIGDPELDKLVESGLKHYTDLFAMKGRAAKADVFYVISGMWTTSAERFFFWIGGFRPSELLKVLLPHLEPLMEQQQYDACNLRQSCEQAEDALTQGMERLQHILADAIADGALGEGGNYLPQIGSAIDKLEALVRFVGQADHLRQETLQQISRILTPLQGAKGLLALGEYMQRLRALSTLWSSQPPKA